MELITSHVAADFDALASMVAARRLYPQAVAAFSGGMDRNVREYVSLFDESLNILSPRSIDPSKVKRLVLVDVQQSRRLGKLAPAAENPNVPVLIYDHHPRSAETIPHARIESADLGATITLILRELREQDLTFEPWEATLFALGLYEETGSLLFGNTTPEDVRTAADLLERGANLELVSAYLHRSLTDRQRDLLNRLLAQTTYHDLHGLRIAVAEAVTKEYVDEIALLAHKLCDIENVNAIFLLIGTGTDVFIVGRSKLEALDVGAVLARLGGGGHHRAASALLKSSNTFEARDRLMRELDLAVGPQPTAADIMSHPVRTVAPETTVEEAAKVLLRFGHSALAVMEGDALAGIVARKDLDRARHHGLHNAPVRACMTKEIVTAAPDASLLQLEETIVAGGVGRVPIFEDGKLRGIVTRTDLLRARYHQPVTPQRTGVPSRPSEGENVAALLEERAEGWLSDLLREIGELAGRVGVEAFAVGGFVRDLLMGTPTSDVDVLVEGDGIRLAKEIAGAHQARLTTHERFGTAVVVLPSSRKVDVASARTEFYEYPAALPEVAHSSVKEDLARRDFTINAMALHLSPGSFGELLDFFGGRQDLKDGLVRVLHSLSFVEDPTRIFRAIRFEQRYGFRLAALTEELIANAAGLELFPRVTHARIRNELELMLSEPDPVPALHRMAHLDVLKHIHERLDFGEEVLAHLERTRDAIACARSLPNLRLRDEWVLYLLPLMKRLTAREVRGLCHRLRLGPRLTALVREATEAASSLLVPLTGEAEMAASKLRGLLQVFSPEALVHVLATTVTERAKGRLRLFMETLRAAKPDITGDDLIREGFRPSRDFGRALEAALEGKIDGTAVTAEAQLDLARRVLAGAGETLPVSVPRA